MSIADVKIVLVGDGSVGKTSLVTAFMEGRFPEDYIPTVVDSYVYDTYHFDHVFKVQIFDTCGGGEFAGVTQLIYDGAHCFIICYSTINTFSVKNIRETWFNRIHSKKKNIPYILCGTKYDLGLLYPDLYLSRKLVRSLTRDKSTDIFEVSAKDEAHRSGSAEGLISLMIDDCILKALAYKFPSEEKTTTNCVMV